MARVQVRPGSRSDSPGFLSLVEALARFERLEPPSKEGKTRLLQDIFRRKRIHLLVAATGSNLVGYALYFYSYSSFLAKPTLYIEDIFVREDWRRQGIGMALLRRCAEEAMEQKCGRMEWAVLKWNRHAIEFYEKMGAKRMDDWDVFRLEENGIKKMA